MNPAPVLRRARHARPRAGPAVRAARAGRSLVTAWADLVLPTACAGCGAPGPRLCGACAAALGGPAGPVRPVPAPRGLPAVHAAGTYGGPVRELIVGHKERGVHAAAGPLGRALAAAVVSALTGEGPRGPGCALVPVPSARAAVRARGHDATLCLARHAARHLRARGTSARVVPVLAHRRHVADQTGLSGPQRMANVTGSMSVRGRLAPLITGINVVIVDDLVTTGATLAEAARAVSGAGGHVVAAAVIAATRRRGDDPVVRMSPGRRQAHRPTVTVGQGRPGEARGPRPRPPPGAGRA